MIKHGGNKMAELARLCGVSPMTVSRALRQNSIVSPATRKLVRDTADRMGYHPDCRMGRPRRKSKRSGRLMVELIFGAAVAPLNMFQTQLLFLMEQELARHEYDCLIRTCGSGYDEFIALCEALRESPARASMITGFFPTERLETILGIVKSPLLVDCAGIRRLSKTFESISFDNIEAARLVVRHLADIGRRRILLLRGDLDHYFAQEMEQGYREVLEECGFPFDPELVRTVDFTVEGAYRSLRDVLRVRIEFDAVFSNDEMALGVLRALHEKRMAVPKDVAVAGCDGLSVGEYTIPRLTTTRLDLPLMASLAVERIMERINVVRPVCRINLLPELLVRESTVADN